MNYGNECYIVYDKYGGGTHSFTNPITSLYGIKELFETKTDDGVTDYIVGIEAVHRFNQKFGDGNFRLPDDLNHDIVSIHMFNFKNKDNCEVIITVVGIDIDKLTKYYDKYNTIPNKEFIVNSCRYHISYEKTINLVENSYASVVGEIVNKVIVPSPDIMDPIIDHPDFIKQGKKLYDYQRRSIKWMLDTEQNGQKIYYGNNYRFEIEIGPLVFDIIKKSIVMKDARDSLQFKGGALIDEVGLGKTIQTLTLCLLNPAPVKDLSYVDESNNMLKSRATLIICPNQLCGQWSREITNMISRSDLKIVLMLTKNHFDKYTYQDLLDADFVIVSYPFIGNACFASKYTTSISQSKSYHKSVAWNRASVEAVFKTMSAELVSDPMCLFQKEPLFPLVYWHRIVIDEFHEAFTSPKYVFVKNIIPLLKGAHKWEVTGTPFDKGTGCFYNMFDFATDYQNSLGENIINLPDVKEHMTKSFFRRNTKKSVEEEFKLPELREKIIWLRFTHTERMMYNAYLTDPNVNRFSEIVRQICCHPKIADEIKGVLSKCKTLSDVENSMVSHYKKQYEHALRGVNKIKRLISKTERRILIVEYKRQRKFLKQKGYQVKIDLPDFEFPDNTGIEIDESDDVPDDLVPNALIPAELGQMEEDNNDGLNLDDLSDDDDDNKPLMIINEENHKMIVGLIKKQLDANPSLTINNFKETLRQQNERLVNAQKIYDGKKASFDFFNNMLQRIKKFTEKSKAKYEKLVAKAHRKDEQGDEYESDDEDETDEEDDEDNCGICMCEISGEDVGVTKCGHIFCFECLKTSINSTSKCPMCSTPQTNKDISMISFEKPVFTKENSQILKTKLELIDKVGTKLSNLIYYLNSIPDHVIIFSQWDSLLRKVGDVLSEHGIPTVYCKGNVWSRDKAIREFNANDKIKVIMLSSESAASGTNLTKASKVILLDPVSGNYEYRRNMEWQAIGRAYRLGQTKQVEIVRLIIKDTVEEEIYKDNKIEDVKQNTHMNISEVTDETITLTDDKLHSIAEAVKIAKEVKDQKNKEKIQRQEKKKLAADKKLIADKKLTKVVKKTIDPVPKKKVVVAKNDNRK